MRSILAFLFIVIITSSVVFAEPAADESDLIMLEGESEITVQADRAVVSIRVLTEDDNFESALKQNQEMRFKLISELKKSGVSPDDISASRFSSTPEYGFFSKKPSRYKVENQIKVSISREEDFHVIARAVDTYKEMDYQGIEFKHSDKEKLRNEAIAKACDDVMSKNEVYENKFGLKLTPKTFKEVDAVEGQRPVFYQGNMETEKLYNRAPSIPSFDELIFRGHVKVFFAVE